MRPDIANKTRRGITVLNVRGEDQDIEQAATRMGRDVTLAALDLLARVIAARPAHRNYSLGWRVMA